MDVHLGRHLVVLILAALLAGCKLTVIATSGGNVKSSSNTHDCTHGQVCTFDLAAGFGEEFLADARPGYKFVGWQQGTGSNNGGFLCGNSRNPVCLVQLPSDANGAAIAALPDIGYLMPIFCVDTDSDSTCNSGDADDDNDGLADAQDNCPRDANNQDGFGCPTGTPITNTVTADGRIWAQPNSFTAVTHTQLATACPVGNCTGMLAGFPVTGWTWANAHDVLHLVETVRGAGLNCPVPCSYTGIFGVNQNGVCGVGACPSVVLEMGGRGFLPPSPGVGVEGWVSGAIFNTRAGFGPNPGGSVVPPWTILSEWFKAGTPGDGAGAWLYKPAAP